jgi:LPPG:FO 2-phospho-L-lactate transferase
MTASAGRRKILALCGGVGGAKLALGLSKILAPQDLTIVTNTGDDFEHLGLRISPDIDTVMYTLADLNNKETGWGRAGETWAFMDGLKALGGESWFQLGDQDLATHIERTRRLAQGASLSAVTTALAGKLGVKHPIVPMSDDPVRTLIHTPSGTLSFQHYFVRDKCEPPVTGFDIGGADKAKMAPAFADALNDPDLACIVICPSNPFVSIGPLLAIRGVREALRASPAPVIAVSPIVGGQAIKGPSAKMMTELGLEVTAASVAEHYGDILDGFVLDNVDAGIRASVENPRLAVTVTNTVMITLEDRVALARHIVDLAEQIRA